MFFFFSRYCSLPQDSSPSQSHEIIILNYFSIETNKMRLLKFNKSQSILNAEQQQQQIRSSQLYCLG